MPVSRGITDKGGWDAPLSVTPPPPVPVASIYPRIIVN